ncbi:hypothetical protein HanRHA438_Chr06g0256281 [Helianthus annuus]|nr:hypothetical protein HanRHA438_Chr06g0256281 [Helianthus annuus]
MTYKRCTTALHSPCSTIFIVTLPTLETTAETLAFKQKDPYVVPWYYCAIGGTITFQQKSHNNIQLQKSK